MCRVWMCRACGKSLPEGLRCLSLLGMILLLFLAAATLITWYFQAGMYFGLIFCYVLAVLGYLIIYGGVRVCSPSLIVFGTLFHFLLLFLIPAALYWYASEGLPKYRDGNGLVVVICIMVAHILYTLFELYYTLAACSAFALLSRNE